MVARISDHFTCPTAPASPNVTGNIVLHFQRNFIKIIGCFQTSNQAPEKNNKIEKDYFWEACAWEKQV